MGMGLFLADWLGEVMRRLVGTLRKLGWWDEDWQVRTRSAITQARQRLGVEPMKALFERAAVPVATSGTKGAWLGRRRLLGYEATRLVVAGPTAHTERIGQMGSGQKAPTYTHMAA